MLGLIGWVYVFIFLFVVEMSAEWRDNGLGLGVAITAHGSEDGTRIRKVLNSGRDTSKYKY
jgi:hypothetical protein